MCRFSGILGMVLAVLAAACTSAVEREARLKTGGDTKRGLQLIGKYGCSACHLIPGIDDSIGTKGPALRGLASRPSIGAGFPNTPENVINWLKNPVRYDRYTEMPNQGITEAEARDIVAYLYTLK